MLDTRKEQITALQQTLDVSMKQTQQALDVIASKDIVLDKTSDKYEEVITEKDRKLKTESFFGTIGKVLLAVGAVVLIL